MGHLQFQCTNDNSHRTAVNKYSPIWLVYSVIFFGIIVIVIIGIIDIVIFFLFDPFDRFSFVPGSKAPLALRKAHDDMLQLLSVRISLTSPPLFFLRFLLEMLVGAEDSLQDSVQVFVCKAIFKHSFIITVCNGRER